MSARQNDRRQPDITSDNGVAAEDSMVETENHGAAPDAPEAANSPGQAVEQPASPAASGGEETRSQDGRTIGPADLPDVEAAPEAGTTPAEDKESARSSDDVMALDVIGHLPSPPPSAVKIKGRAGGIFVEIGEGVWADLLDTLGDRLKSAAGFFRGASVILDVGHRSLTSEELRYFISLLKAHEMALGVVLSSDEGTLQHAAELGISTSSTQEAAHPGPVAPVQEAAPAKPDFYVHQGSLRAGQALHRQESIFIIGDVNPGAQVSSAGDVYVWGRMRGVAHAGVEGDQTAVVAALELTPTQLRIGDVIAVPPESKGENGSNWFWKRPPPPRAEVAHVVDGRILIEPWDEIRTGGWKAFSPPTA